LIEFNLSNSVALLDPVLWSLAAGWTVKDAVSVEQGWADTRWVSTGSEDALTFDIWPPAVARGSPACGRWTQFAAGQLFCDVPRRRLIVPRFLHQAYRAPDRRKLIAVSYCAAPAEF
jgi:hypothetical protein